jgi:hypothetical protein
MSKKRRPPINTWATIYAEDWRWLHEMVDLESGDGLGEDYLVLARKKKQTKQWRPVAGWKPDWYHKPWPC